MNITSTHDLRVPHHDSEKRVLFVLIIANDYSQRLFFPFRVEVKSGL